MPNVNFAPPFPGMFSKKATVYFCIYDGPKCGCDAPFAVLAWRWGKDEYGDHLWAAFDDVRLAQTLEAAQRMLPPGMTKRESAAHWNILEVWSDG
jgi:hypothetical protein